VLTNGVLSSYIIVQPRYIDKQYGFLLLFWGYVWSVFVHRIERKPLY